MVRRSPGYRPLTAAAVVALALAGLTACTADPPLPDDAAASLARGLSTGDLTEVPLTGTTAAEASDDVTRVLGGLDPLRPDVALGTVELAEDGQTATATLEHTWDVDAGDVDWTYTTTAQLELVEEEGWVVRWSPDLLAPDVGPDRTLTVRRTAAERAPVLGGDGTPLVESRPVHRLGLDKTRVEVEAQDAAAHALAELLGIDPAGFADRVAASGERAFVEGLVVRAADPVVDLDEFRALEGALVVDDELPLAPTRRFARALLGTAGAATAEIIEASQGQVGAGDLAGLSGLQRQYDEQLRGRPGMTILATDDEDEEVLFTLEPVDGEPLRTTLDLRLQDVAESVLDGVEPASAIVAIRPSTGAVLAAASGPGSEGYSTATLGTYAPGSVFKVVSSLALLRAGLTPSSELECPSTITVDGRGFTNFPGYPDSATGTITLRTAVAHSCNTAFIGARDQAPATALVDSAAALGLGGEADLGFPAFLGSIPSDASGTDHAASMIGQGRIQASPLAMATVAASVAAGRTVVPWLVGDEAPDPGEPAQPLTAEEAEALRELMRAVVTEGGGQFLEQLGGEEILAKTGTAQVGTDALTNHAWMIAIQGDLAVAVLVEEGDYGSTTAGPLLAQFLSVVAD